MTAGTREPRLVSDAVEDASRALIATILATGAIPKAAADLKPADLALAAHGEVLNLAREIEAIGPVTPHAIDVRAAQRGVSARLPEGGRAGWGENLARDHSVIPARIPQLVDIIRSHAARKKLELAGVEAVSRARSGQPAVEIADDLVRAAGLVQSQLAGPESSCISLATVKAVHVTWIWYGRLAIGKLTVIDGLPGSGKSTATCELAARISRGQRFPGERQAQPAGGVLFIAAEDGIADTLVPRLQAAGADIEQCHVWCTDKLPALPDDAPDIEAAIIAYKIKLLICDPITGLFARDLSANSDADVRRALTPLVSIAERHGVCVVLLRHLNKRTGGSALDRGGGSIGIAALARTVLLLGRDDDDPECRILASVKANLTRMPRSLRARIVDVDGVGKIEWLDECDTSADDLVAESTGASRQASKVDAAADYLRSLLADGEWHRQQEIVALLDGEGIPEKTWKRAKAKLAVESRQRSSNGSRDGWWWRLNQEATPGSATLCPPGTPDPLGFGDPLRKNNTNYLPRAQGHRVAGSDIPAEGQGSFDAEGGRTV